MGVKIGNVGFCIFIFISVLENNSWKQKLIFFFIIPPANCACGGGGILFHIRPSVPPSVRSQRFGFPISLKDNDGIS